MSEYPGAILRLDLTETTAFDGRSFDGVGQYKLWSGSVVGELDPAHPDNARIVDLALAPRNARGRVEYRTDVAILAPADAAAGNGWLLYDVVNRGNKLALTRLCQGADGNGIATAPDAGDGLLMRQGYAIAWSGWQGDTPAGMGRMTADFPVARSAKPGLCREEFIAEGAGGPGDAAIQEVSDSVFVARLSYPAADTDPARAALTMRVRERDPRGAPEGLSWRYLDARRIEVTRPPGADRGAIYEFVYTARDPVVLGIGFAAIRDLVSFLRRDPTVANPLAGRIRRAVGFGISQSGRVLRDMAYQGFNRGLDGEPVFDAMMPVVAGSRRTWVNARWAQPGRYSRQHEDHSFLDDQFPFTYATTTDPVSDATDGILAPARAQGACPKVIHLDADADLWAARASLVATDAAGGDAEMPDDARIFCAAATQHAVFKPAAKQVAKLGGNPLGYAWAMRALLAALTAWVDDGVEPPASRFPSRADGTLGAIEDARAAFPAISGVDFPARLNVLHRRDHSVEPPIEGAEYPALVAMPDADGNSRGGLRHPLLAAPLGTHTGWAVRGPGYAEGDLFTVQGSYIPFAATEAERGDDPRPSFEARYGSRMVWMARVISAAELLVSQRLLLREDADRFVAALRRGEDPFAVL